MNDYIIFEGIDGCGKSTLSKYIAERLGAFWTYEPYGDSDDVNPENWELFEATNMLRKLCLSKAYSGIMTSTARELLMLANRSIHHEMVKKKLQNQSVVSDRSIISGRVYKKVASPDFPLQLWDSIYSSLKLTPPTIVVFVTGSESKLKEGNDDIYDTAKEDFHKKIQEEFQLQLETFWNRSGSTVIQFTNKFDYGFEFNAESLYLMIDRIIKTRCVFGGSTYETKM